jgi:hypothetical protein
LPHVPEGVGRTDHGVRARQGGPAALDTRPAGGVRSSSLAERHFCSACGTPLSYHFIDSGNISVTAGSLDDPEAVRPVLQYSADRMLSWFRGLADLPGKRMDEFITADLAERFVSHQHPDHET